MSGKTAKPRKGGTSARPTVKITVRVSIELAQRLGVEAAMRRVTQSAVVEEVMGAYLRRWRMPATCGPISETETAGNDDPK